MTVDEYLDAAPEPQQSTLRAIRSTLRSILPDAEEGMSYGVPAFKVDGTAVAGFKGHCGYYPHSGSVLEQLADQLTDYDWAKGTLRFAIDTPLPAALVERMVRLRLDQLASG